MIWCKPSVRCHLRVCYSPTPSPLQSWQVLCPSSSLDLTFTTPPQNVSHTLLVSCKSLMSVSQGPEQAASHDFVQPQTKALSLRWGFRDAMPKVSKTALPWTPSSGHEDCRSSWCLGRDLRGVCMGPRGVITGRRVFVFLAESEPEFGRFIWEWSVLCNQVLRGRLCKVKWQCHHFL